MTRRAIAGAGAAAIGAATAVTALVLGTVTGYAAPGTSSAFGVELSGAIPLEATPLVESTDGSEQTGALIEIPENPLVSATVAGLMAGNNVASAELADVSAADQVTASAVEASCKGTSGTTTIIGLEIPGGDFAESYSPEPNTKVIPEPLDGVAQITLNRQTTNGDGTFTVDGIVIDLIDSTQEIVVSSATCGGPAKDGGDDDGDGDDGGSGPTATKPAPITTGLPVTG